MRRKLLLVVYLRRASLRRHQVKRSKRNSRHSRFLTLMTVSFLQLEWPCVDGHIIVPPPSSETEAWWETPGKPFSPYRQPNKITTPMTLRSPEWRRRSVSRYRPFRATARKSFRPLASRLSVISLTVFVRRGAIQPCACTTNAHGSFKEPSTASTATTTKSRS
jgi:hypothetical protein